MDRTLLMHGRSSRSGGQHRGDLDRRNRAGTDRALHFSTLRSGPFEPDSVSTAALAPHQEVGAFGCQGTAIAERPGPSASLLSVLAEQFVGPDQPGKVLDDLTCNRS